MKNFQYIHDENNIKGFFHKYEFLSNFYLCPVKYDNILYPSSENAYQAQKTLDKKERKQFVDITPNQSKKLGRKVQLREDWDISSPTDVPIKILIMSHIVNAKFLQNEDLRELLLQTEDKHLEESNWWKDKVYGTYNGEGENWLGRILMRCRGMLREAWIESTLEDEQKENLISNLNTENYSLLKTKKDRRFFPCPIFALPKE